MSPRHLLEIDDLTADELAEVLRLAADHEMPQVLSGMGVALIFEKPSARTRHSSEVAVIQLGGHPVTARGDELGIDTREPAEDIARTLSCYHAAIGARVFDHRLLERMASASSIPVINLLSDSGHPCQAVADLLTLQDRLGPLQGRTVTWVGDFNNVARSLALASALVGLNLRVASPPGYGPSDEDIDRVAAVTLHGSLAVVDRPADAVDWADAVMTDVWTSMGQEADAEVRRRAFEGFSVTPALLEAAAPDAVFMHCLPAHRGEEVDAAVVDGPQSLVWQQAANRMHAMRGVLRFLVEEGR